MNKMRKKATAVLFYPAIDEIDDVDAKQYHRASFSTRNSVLNTSLRKPIRMQDFIQLCDSRGHYVLIVGALCLNTRGHYVLIVGGVMS